MAHYLTLENAFKPLFSVLGSLVDSQISNKETGNKLAFIDSDIDLRL